ncbi:flagellar protein [Bacillus sp. A301a_S52]|nr:flagellar protein [Bacillus sp. A301a_S52]
MTPKIMPHHLQQPLPKPTTVHRTSGQADHRFKQMLTHSIEEQSELKISKHAEKRLLDRGIDVAGETWSEIHSKIKEAKQKGVTDSLVLTNEAAFVVSAQNETVITAMDREEAATQLFTNINGAIVINT